MTVFAGQTAGGVSFSVEQSDGKLPQFSSELATELRHIPYSGKSVRDFGGSLPEQLDVTAWIDNANVSGFKALRGTSITLIYCGTTYSGVYLVKLTGWEWLVQENVWTCKALFEKST